MKSTANRRMMTGFALAAAIGTLIGTMTLIGQKILPVNLNFLCNSASVWIVPAFSVPYFLKGNTIRSAFWGMVVLIFCVAGYYVFEAVSNHHAYYVNSYQVLWLCCAVIGGAVIGLCGNLARTRGDIVSNICRNMLPAVFVTEASSKLFHTDDYRHMILGLFLQMFIGTVLYAVINGKNALKKANILSFLILLILGNMAFEALRKFG